MIQHFIFITKLYFNKSKFVVSYDNLKLTKSTILISKAPIVVRVILSVDYY